MEIEPQVRGLVHWIQEVPVANVNITGNGRPPTALESEGRAVIRDSEKFENKRPRR
jgi:hypothetical protein